MFINIETCPNPKEKKYRKTQRHEDRRMDKKS